MDRTTKYFIHIMLKGEPGVLTDEFGTEDIDEAFDIAQCLYEIDGVTVESVEKA